MESHSKVTQVMLPLAEEFCQEQPEAVPLARQVAGDAFDGKQIPANGGVMHVERATGRAGGILASCVSE
jgi:hypothetical protein